MKLKKFICMTLAITMMTVFIAGCSSNASNVMKFGKGKQTLNWNPEIVDHGSYKDLGHYVIDMGEISQQAFADGAVRANEKLDTLKTESCTGIVKKNSKGQVIMGRNQDEEVSNYPVLVFHLTGGKQQAVSFYYSHQFDYTYEQLQKGLELEDSFRGMMASASTDAFNESGLYIQTNMRTNVGVKTTGTNPGAERVPMIGVASRVAQNASTVAEALDYINTLDVYTTGNVGVTNWDYAFMIGDATGEYGIIEFANNEMYYTPYANGHGNAFVSPLLTQYDRYNAGYGRLHIAQQAMIGAETDRDMMEAVHKADWYHEVQDIQYSYRDENGKVHFVDKDGNPSIDWRSEFVGRTPVDDFGESVNKEFNLLDYLTPGQIADLSNKDKEEIDAFNDAMNKHFSQNSDKFWVLDDNNFEEVKEMAEGFFKETNAQELLEKFFNGDKQPLRDSGEVFTTGMNFGVNCAEKHLIARFLEDEECIYEFQW